MTVKVHAFTSVSVRKPPQISFLVKYFTQEQAKLIADEDGYELYIGIKKMDKTYPSTKTPKKRT